MGTITIGGDTAWRAYSRGDIGVAFHWLDGEPAMVIYALRRRMRLCGSVPYALPLSSAHELVRPGGHEVDAVALVKKATKAAELIGAPGDGYMIRRIADAMLDGLDTLCDMPPEPESIRASEPEAGRAKLYADGKLVCELDEG